MRRCADVEAATELETPTDVNAIAAGEVVAAARGRPVEGLREDVQQLAIFVGPEVTPDHAIRAHAAAQRVLAGSEVAALWGESADGAEWRRSIDDLVRRLSS